MDQIKEKFFKNKDKEKLYNDIVKFYKNCRDTERIIRELSQRIVGPSIDYSDLDWLLNHRAFEENDLEEKVRICLFGAFSSGKSSFINSLLDEDIAPVDVNASTGVISRFIYGETDAVFDVSGESYSKEEYQKFAILGHDKNNEMESDRPIFNVFRKKDFLKDIVLSDVPGFDSGDEDDRKISKQEALNSDAIMLLVRIQGNKGVLPESLLNEITELFPEGAVRKLYLVLTQSERTTESARNNILKQIRMNLSSKNIEIEQSFFYACGKNKEGKNHVPESRREFYEEQKAQILAFMPSQKEWISKRTAVRNGVQINTLRNRFDETKKSLEGQIDARKSKVCNELDKAFYSLKKKLKAVFEDVRIVSFDLGDGLLFDSCGINFLWNQEKQNAWMQECLGSFPYRKICEKAIKKKLEILQRKLLSFFMANKEQKYSQAKWVWFTSTKNAYGREAQELNKLCHERGEFFLEEEIFPFLDEERDSIKRNI